MDGNQMVKLLLFVTFFYIGCSVTPRRMYGESQPLIRVGIIENRKEVHFKIEGKFNFVDENGHIKARNVDPSVTENANKQITNYSKYFPGKEDAFFLGLNNGDSYTVGCWIGETTAIRTIGG